MNVAADLAQRAEQQGWSSTPAFFDEHRMWTHGEVHDLAARAATVLGEAGVRPGDRVLLALPDSIGWVVTFLAVARVGATAVLVNPGLPAADHEFIADDCAAALCVTGAELRDHFGDRRWADIEHVLARSAGAARAEAWPCDARSPLYLQYTSGTTGEPKGVVHHHDDLAVYHDAVAGKVLGIQATDVTLSVSKLFFAYGFGNAFVFPLYSGSSAVLLAARPTAEMIEDAVRRHRVTLFYAVPSAYATMVDRGEPAAFESVRTAVSAGETLPPALGERATILLGAPVCEQIGSTEAGHAYCANSPDDNVPGTLGRPVPGYDVELRDRQGRPVPDGETGELWVRGPTLLSEYLNRPAETARALAGGWLATRDLACRQGDGTIRHLGRVDDMEMVGGITVSPIEVERLFAEHPLVREVAVAAVPDHLGATKLRAFVVPARPVSAPADLETELIALARQRLASFKVPRTVRAVASLPRTATGKLRRHIVRTGAW